jgi:hypothetical protein
MIHEAMRVHLFAFYNEKLTLFNEKHVHEQSKCESAQLYILRGVIKHIEDYPRGGNDHLLRDSDSIIYGCERLKANGGELESIACIIPPSILPELTRIY